MKLATLQNHLAKRNKEMTRPFASGIEFLATMTEELGEVATEVSLFEQVGSKADWQKDPSKERLAEELTHLLNVTFGLASFYEIDLEALYTQKFSD